MSSRNRRSETGVEGFQLVILILSVYVLGALFVETVCKLSPQTASLLDSIDNAICFVFLGDFFYRLYHAEDKKAFMRWGWIDFISSIPMVEAFRWGRVVRVVRILRLLRGIRSMKIILGVLFRNRAKGTFLMVGLISLTLVIFSSLAVLNVETVPEANIKNASDALWWSVVTITTVGYGDKYPVTMAGRIVGTILMTAGVGLFGTFTAYVASFFVTGNKNREEENETDIAKELRLLRERIDHLESKLTPDPVKLPAQFGSRPELTPKHQESPEGM